GGRVVYSEEMKYRFEPTMELQFRGIQTLVYLLRNQYDKADQAFVQSLADAETAYKNGWRMPDFVERMAAICALRNAKSATDKEQKLPDSLAKIRDMCPLDKKAVSATHYSAGKQRFVHYLVSKRDKQDTLDSNQLRQLVGGWLGISPTRDTRCDEV
ncbi:MAG: hypothetical protein OEQ74_00705, partial [Gammaproteobacteria bacterium]|nr:hypothetical protein [Gammaproteobacteria bacterium]